VCEEAHAMSRASAYQLRSCSQPVSSNKKPAAARIPC
jgi:hypothetical protein